MVTIAFVLSIPLIVLLFATLRPARAATLAYLGGWLLLPATSIEIEGFLNIDKTLVIAVGVIMGVLLCCRNPLQGAKGSWSDVLLVAFAAAASVSSVTNGLGNYDAASVFLHRMLYYGVAFGCGRLFLRNRDDLHEAALALCHGAALYALLALWEWRMSPQIHQFLYGEFQHHFLQHKRWSFYRPVVCFPHTLALGMFLAAASVVSVWLFLHKRLTPLRGIPPLVIVGLLLLGLLSCMSGGPWALFAAGFLLLWTWRAFRLRGFVAVPLVFALTWISVRYTGVSDGEWLVSMAQEVSADRATSLQYRIDAETVLLDHARERPWCGWGGWSRNQVFRASGRNAFANDGLWVIVVGQNGLLGLAALYLWWCRPLVMALSVDRRLEGDPTVMALLAIIGLEAVNTLFNGVMSPLMIFFAGGVATVLAGMRGAAGRTATASTFGSPSAGSLFTPSTIPGTHR